MEIIIYLITGLAIGTLIGWLAGKATGRFEWEKKLAGMQQQYADLDKAFAGYRAAQTMQVDNLREQVQAKAEELLHSQQAVKDSQLQILDTASQLTGVKAELRAAHQLLQEKQQEAELLKEEVRVTRLELAGSVNRLAGQVANNEALQEKLHTQKEEMAVLNKKFTTEFENIANRILETKTEKFTELNKTNLNSILEPLGKNISEFKTKVEEVYQKESQQRFSLGERVKELAELNRKISEEANNLTRALKSESKTQGGWGEMILENILQRSGLVRDREYFMEHQLYDEQGNALRSDAEDKKMRPDAVIKYPDNRHVIIDSKVSLNAFTRAVDATDEATRLHALNEHVAAIKRHIQTLSAKGYDDYNKTLDFVMMFVPSEPAYIAALQADAELWNYAYDRRILLLSPTNLITSLKLIVDLWKREYQNQNANEIAERGAKLYDKFVGFISNLEDVGDHLQKAQNKYGEAYKQLATGNDNLVTQATKLKDLGLKTKKSLPENLLNRQGE
ncbi:DNA recombination protein RmuC [Lacibacter cauensis]|uniref:DNA recombination protein RmuC n=1 Tax=Lacibacter cauensis TaxID=510947 RepID=A0A562S9D0_9BACT|nr:DNA recombination protein RmuC [Lacibacter cauensis]TWI78001.1 DNA recombination protein RmuC [Lacibacter cauensis]